MNSTTISVQGLVAPGVAGLMCTLKKGTELNSSGRVRVDVTCVTLGTLCVCYLKPIQGGLSRRAPLKPQRPSLRVGGYRESASEVGVTERNE
jgi:hypothetical protein